MTCFVGVYNKQGSITKLAKTRVASVNNFLLRNSTVHLTRHNAGI